MWTVILLFLAAAGALWGATRLDGGASSGTGLALVALAGAGGSVAVGGWGRRVVGALVTVAGGLAVWQVVTGDAGGIGWWTSLLGGVLLVVAGLSVIRLAARLPVLGARYRSVNARGVSGDADKDMWDGLTEGRDPTVSKVDDER